MTRLIRLIALFFHLFKAFYVLLRYFHRFDSQTKTFSKFQQKIISDWLAGVLSIMGISIIIKPSESLKSKQNETKLSTEQLRELLYNNMASKIIVSNHVSWLDVVVLGHLFPVRFIAKREIASWPLISFLVSKTGTFFIRRGRASELKKLSQHIKFFLGKGESLMFFPEGKTGAGEKVQSLFSGLFQVAIDTNSEVQPIFLSYEDDSYPSTIAPYVDNQFALVNLWHVIALKNLTIHISIGDTIYPQDKKRKQIAGEVKFQLESMLEHEFKT